MAQWPNAVGKQYTGQSLEVTRTMRLYSGKYALKMTTLRVNAYITSTIFPGERFENQRFKGWKPLGHPLFGGSSSENRVGTTEWGEPTLPLYSRKLSLRLQLRVSYKVRRPFLRRLPR